VSDIPIGTPPSPPGRHAAPGGWYQDPIDAAQERYWDGWQWSRNTRPREGAAPPATAGQSYGGQPYGGQPHGGQTYGGQPHGGQTYGDQPYGGQPGSTQGPYSDQHSQGQQQYPPQPYAGQQPYVGPPYGNQVQQTAPAPLGGRAQAAFTADGVPLSGWWWRVLAACLDSFFISLLVAIPAFPIYQRMYVSIAAYVNEVLSAARSGQAPPAQPDVTSFLSSTDQVALLAIQIGVALVYDIAFLRWKSATPGMLICSLRVVPVDEGRSPGPLSWSSVVIRTLVWVLPGISTFLIFFRVLDGLFPLWQPKRQALHDLAARTQVVRPIHPVAAHQLSA
jgi:uncharacterized RDD family membrane protein YckC